MTASRYLMKAQVLLTGFTHREMSEEHVELLLSLM